LGYLFNFIRSSDDFKIKTFFENHFENKIYGNKWVELKLSAGLK